MVMNSKNLLPMENEKNVINNYVVDSYRINTLVIGSGAASLNAAVRLHSMGQKDILIATSEWGGGTSNNAGSDKQTYYKLSLSGGEPDSIPEMARDLYNGKCMHGDIALCEAQGSVQAFMNLVNLGVPFPHDKYGSWVGYKTDHDPRARATSAGPNTSKMMFEVLAGEVKKRKIKVLNHYHVIALLTDKDKTKVIGALAINIGEDDPEKAFVLFNATNIILGTGGPAGIYRSSVYPSSQTGSTGMAFEAGVAGQNLTESQFGIASLKFRWNLSGSYQQTLPRYFSTDKDGNDEKEFLSDIFSDYTALTRAIFLKGYQWPFDPGKVAGYGSSLIDLLVFRESEERGRRVWIDFRRNPSWWNNESFAPDRLDPEAYRYLVNSGALRETPVERLQAMNAPAVSVFRENGIDLYSEPLEIAVCAQHNNGGLKGNIWWESDLKHLFPVGEVNGSHGVYRPGGSALNSGQVGSHRAAMYIFKKYNSPAMTFVEFLAETNEQIVNKLTRATHWLSSGKKGMNGQLIGEIRKRMSEAGGIIRTRAKVLKGATEAAMMFNQVSEKTGAASVPELVECFILMDQCLTHYVYLEAIKTYIEKGGRSRGSYIVTDKENSDPFIRSDKEFNINLCQYDREIEKNILVTRFKEGWVISNVERVKEIPSPNLWFEKVWKDYLEDNYL
jgi:succinate dehydrogenase/fumarate reductase flavoprotein subunit